jgi:hypothetical protein
LDGNENGIVQLEWTRNPPKIREYEVQLDKKNGMLLVGRSVSIAVRCRFPLGRVSWNGSMPVGDGVRAYLTVYAGSGSMRLGKGPVGVSGGRKSVPVRGKRALAGSTERKGRTMNRTCSR